MPKRLNPFHRVNTSPLVKVIAERIQRNGPMTVAEYMSLALSDPTHGYYITRDPIGADGDFVTSPEVSQMFGEMIGAWITDIWLQMGKPESVKLIELGPGRGTLSADILRTISSWPEFKAAMTVHLIETSPMLRQKQFEALKAWRPTWYDTFDETPVGVSFIIANEFFDALPVHQLEKSNGSWMERKIDYHPGRNEFFTSLSPLTFDVASLMPPDFLSAPDGSVFEVSPASLALLSKINARIGEFGGAGLIIDYGHVQPGLGDTLQAVLKHAYSTVLEDPGEKDITAHVDFGTFKTVAESQVRVHGPVTQGSFLTALGIGTRAESLKAEATDRQKKDIDQALHRLTALQEMGGLFKVMGVTPKDKRLSVSGFNEKEINHEVSDNGAG